MKYDKWDKEQFIQDYERLHNSYKMAKLYGCSRKTITSYASRIGYDYSKNIAKKIKNVAPEEILYLYQSNPNCPDIAQRYGCSTTAVRNYLHELGVETLNPNNKLPKDPQEFIAQYEQLKSVAEMAQFYHCSTTAIYSYANKIHYKLSQYTSSKLNTIDKQYILNHYDDISSNQLAKTFQVSRGMITKLWHDNHLKGKKNITPQTTAIDLTGQRFGKWTVLNKTSHRSASGGIKWLCRCDCGICREVASLSLLQGVSLSCGAHANISKGNEKIKTLLQQAQIPFEIEKTFFTCKDKRPLPFDFYVNDSYLIEYDGWQHFNQDTIFDYEYTHAHDQIKNQWCQEYNITLIRIPYTHYKELKIQDLIPETSDFVEYYADLKLDKIGES